MTIPRVERGDHPRASDINQLAAAIKRNAESISRLRGKSNLESPVNLCQLVDVVNDAGEDTKIGHAYGIDELSYQRSGTNYREHHLTVKKPSVRDPDNIGRTDHHIGKYVVCLDKIADGGAGRAAIAGLVRAEIDVQDEDDLYCRLEHDSTKLYSDASGSALILWKESGTGTKWAWLLIGLPAWSGCSYVKAQGDESSGIISVKHVNYDGTEHGAAFDVWNAEYEGSS